MTVPARALEHVENSAGAVDVVQWLDRPAATAQLGGKARPLTALLAAGLPVPTGFVIVAEAFPEASHMATPTEGSPSHRLAQHVQEQVRHAYAELARRTGDPMPLVAVRSSAAAEDLAGASFAGQYETFLGVRGADQVVEYAARCWASLWSDHATSYREHVAARAVEPLPEPAMAVLVQVLIPADAAGVAFSADPLTGDTAMVIINGAWGVGQSVVDGEVEADTWRVDRHTRVIVAQTTGSKPTRSGIGPGATRVSLPEALVRQPCLTPAQVLDVAALTLRAEEVIGAPADVEWAIDGDSLWVLQARPITTGVTGASQPATPAERGHDGAATAGAAGAHELSPAKVEPSAGPSATFPFVWPDDEAPTLPWKLRTIDQRRPEVMRPLELEVRRHFVRSLQQAAAVKGGETMPRALHLNGYEYMTDVKTSASDEDRQLRKDTFERASNALHERGETYLQAVVFPEVDAENARLQAVEVDTIAPAELAGHLEDAFRRYERSWTLHWLWAPNGPRERFAALYKDLTGDERREAPGELVTHEPNLLTAAIDGLLDLARIVQRHSPLRALVESTGAEEVLERLAGVEGADEFRSRLERLLAEQGLRCGAGFGTEQNQCLPGWAEQPSVVIALVQKYVPQDLAAIQAAREAGIRRRDERLAEIRRQIASPEQLTQFEFWLAAARRAHQGFEDHNYKIDSAANALVHRAIMASARRLVAAGVVAEVDDVWWLQRNEVTLALRDLDAARRLRWNSLLDARKASSAWYESLTPPPSLGAPAPDEKKPDGPPPPASGAGATRVQPPAHVLVTGQTGASGVATGRVRLTDYRALVPEVQPGDVLVAHNAGPLWTPLFPTVAAVVLDEGVFFQHAMLTCREYGVPALFQTKDATTRLREGQRITVDATNGWIVPVEEAAPPAPPA